MPRSCSCPVQFNVCLRLQRKCVIVTIERIIMGRVEDVTRLPVPYGSGGLIFTRPSSFAAM